MKVISLVISVVLLLLPACAQEPISPTQEPGPILEFTRKLYVKEQPVSGTEHSSSTQLSAEWEAPAESVHHYRLAYQDTVTQRAKALILDGNKTLQVIQELKSATRYRVELRACLDEACTDKRIYPEADATTAEEVWQLLGSGADVDSLDQVVSDGNVKIHAIRYGSDAPADLAGRIQLYYGPSGNAYKGVAIARSTEEALHQNSDSVMGFSPYEGSVGLISPSFPSHLVKTINTAQAVPLSAGMGAAMRLYFEAQGSDDKTRILSLDSRDGWHGLDFNADLSSVCSGEAEYSSTGGCEPTVVIGVEGDPIRGNAKIDHARQFKIGYPTMDDWKWNGEDGTFMWITVGQVSGCSTNHRNTAYAHYINGEWEIQRDGDCPLLFEGIQAPSPVHLGDSRYKLYFGVPDEDDARPSDSNLPFLGPKRVVYSNGENSTVEFDDWESTADARDVQFLWPDGTPLDDIHEGYLDDFTFIAPTNHLEFQFAYLAITDGNRVPFPVGAVLLNP